MGFKETVKSLLEDGLKLPYAYDPTTGKPSITLLFPYVTFLLALAANIALLVKDVFTGTVTAIIFWSVAVIFYLMRKLQKTKIDFDDKSIELESDDEQDESK